MARTPTPPPHADRGSALYVATPLAGLAGREALAEQRRRVRAYLRVRGWRARHHAFFQDPGSTAAPRWRPGMKELLAAAARGGFSRVTAVGTALSDDPLLAASIAQELSGQGVELTLVPDTFEAAAAASVPPLRAARPRPLLVRLQGILRRVEAAVAENQGLRAEQVDLRAQVAEIRRRASAVAGLGGAPPPALGRRDGPEPRRRAAGRVATTVPRRRRRTEA
ncbi:MAG TPA: recombinase family protein [Candidatus Micrarchaeia archaeon]|nr:recombinase family protein [Candidatus Micrarchaeia archaeon]